MLNIIMYSICILIIVILYLMLKRVTKKHLRAKEELELFYIFNKKLRISNDQYLQSTCEKQSEIDRLKNKLKRHKK